MQNIKDKLITKLNTTSNFANTLLSPFNNINSKQSPINSMLSPSTSSFLNRNYADHEDDNDDALLLNTTEENNYHENRDNNISKVKNDEILLKKSPSTTTKATRARAATTLTTSKSSHSYHSNNHLTALNNKNSNNSNNNKFVSSNSNKTSNKYKSSSTGILVDIGLFSDLGGVESNKGQNQSDDDVPMLNPNFEQTDELNSHQNSNRSTSSIIKQNYDVNHTSLSLPSQNLIEDEHCHVSKRDMDALKRRNAPIMRKLITVLLLCTLFMIAEIVGGLIAHSISIQTDAAHMAADIIGFFFSIIAIFISQWKPTRRMSFGYYRSEVLGALFSTLIIWVLTGVLVYLAILRCIDQSFEIESIAMVTTASLGVLFNIAMYFILHTNKCFNGIDIGHHGHSHGGGGHGHSRSGNNHGHSHSGDGHGHSHSESGNEHGHSHSSPKNKRNNSQSLPINDSFSVNTEVSVINDSTKDDTSNINLRAAAVHVIGDFIQSLGVLVAALVIHFKPEYKLADPICTFVFSVLVIFTTAPIIRDIYYVLMEALPININYDLVMQDLCELEHVKKAHNLHIWCLTMDKYALSVHLVTENNTDTQKTLKDANDLLRSKYNIEKMTIQVEYFKESMDSCDDCKPPE